MRHLEDEIRKVIRSEDTVFGKYSGLLESFRTIIPDEKQRYQAALQALSTTSKLSRQEILKAMSGELEELKIVEKNLLLDQSGWRDELLTMEARSQGLKGEIANLRARMTQLVDEERTVLAAAATRQKDLDGAEKSIKDIFADIGAEIISLSMKVGVLSAEAAVAQPGPHAPQASPVATQPATLKEPVRSDAPGKKKEVEQKAGIEGAAPHMDTKFQRKCPRCGGPFNLLELENIWQCFTCAYEEPATDAVQGAGEEKSEPKGAPTPAETPEPIAETTSSSIEPVSMVNGPAGPKKDSSRSGSQPGAYKKACPFCFKKMIWSPGEKVWRCPSGHLERKGDPPGRGSRR
ncbi:MAG: hypothetical protein HGB21_02630 [Nitrospirae bacterium]|nr:hypothetical protein [Nitrospirota bacterium]NTW65199.1 hypothetical protein [Nitrospirota bacterium]